MKHRKPKQKEQRATAVTDLCRLIICAMGCGLIVFPIIGYFDDEADWSPLAALICLVLGLVLTALGIFAKPKTIEGGI